MVPHALAVLLSLIVYLVLLLNNIIRPTFLTKKIYGLLVNVKRKMTHLVLGIEVTGVLETKIDGATDASRE